MNLYRIRPLKRLIGHTTGLPYSHTHSHAQTHPLICVSCFHTTSTSFYSTTTNDTVTAPSGSIGAGILLKRNPIILKPPSQFEAAYLKYRQDLDRNDARPFPADFYFKKGTINEKKWLTALEAVQAEGLNEDQAMEKFHESELAGLKLENPETEADVVKDMKALHRALHKSLYLITKSKSTGQWQLPYSTLNENEVLHEAAERSLKELCGTQMDTWFVGKAPIGHITSKESTPSHIFFMKAHILSGQVTLDQDKIESFAWVTKDELKENVTPEYYSSIYRMLSSE